MIVAILLVVLFVLYLLSLRGRRNAPGWKGLLGWKYAHRGLHDAEKPENSLAAFRAALEHGYGVELDLHLLADGNLGVMHDSDLSRTTGQEGRMEDLTTEDLSRHFLQGTSETIPQFSQVLNLFRGKVPMIIELKTVDNNYAELCEAVCAMLEGYEGPYCIESFDPRCVRWLRQHRPDIIRGQLAENFLKSKANQPFFLRLAVTAQWENFLTVPDFVAYKYAHRNTLGNYLVRNLWGVKGVSWTLRTREEYDTAVSEGWLPIFEGFLPDKPRLPEGEE